MSYRRSVRLSLGFVLVAATAAIALGVLVSWRVSAGATENPLSVNSPVGMSGMGPVKIGMTVEEVRSLLGPITDDKAAYDDGCYFITPLKGPDGLAFMILGDHVARIDITNPAVSTDRGIRIGASEDDIKKAYGEGIEIEPHFYGPPDAHYVRTAATEDKLLMLFETQKGVVTTYRAGEANAVNFVEGCL